MRVLGHGIDAVDVRGLVPNDPAEASAFIARCFTPLEQAAAGDGPHRAERLAARFAAKEAVLKALGIGWGDGVSFTDVEVTSIESGAPRLALHARCQAVARQRGVREWMISLTHTTSLAIASVIMLGDS